MSVSRVTSPFSLKQSVSDATLADPTDTVSKPLAIFYLFARTVARRPQIGSSYWTTKEVDSTPWANQSPKRIVCPKKQQLCDSRRAFQARDFASGFLI
jgi:hypothetical protein